MNGGLSYEESLKGIVRIANMMLLSLIHEGVVVGVCGICLGARDV